MEGCGRGMGGNKASAQCQYQVHILFSAFGGRSIMNTRIEAYQPFQVTQILLLVPAGLLLFKTKW